MSQEREKSQRRLKGFTLPEVLVTVSLIAVLAAVVVPAVASKVQNGPPNAAEQNAVAVRAGIEAFMSDVARTPGNVTELVKAITTSDTDANGIKFSTYNVNRWKGPYVQRDSSTFFGVNTDGPGKLLQSFLITTVSGSNYLTLQDSGVASNVMNQVDLDIDTNADSTTGMVRYTLANNGVLKFLLYPKP